MNPERESPSSSIPFEEVVRIARETVLQDGYHLPTLIVEGSTDSIVLQLQGMGATFEERAQQLFITGYALGHDTELGALRQIFMVTEAWLSLRENGGLPDVPPSSDPKRIEILAISGQNVVSQQTSMALLEMIRDEDGRLVELREEIRTQPEQGSDYSAESPLLDAFVSGYTVGKARWS